MQIAVLGIDLGKNSCNVVAWMLRRTTTAPATAPDRRGTAGDRAHVAIVGRTQACDFDTRPADDAPADVLDGPIGQRVQLLGRLQRPRTDAWLHEIKLDGHRMYDRLDPR